MPKKKKKAAGDGSEMDAEAMVARLTHENTALRMQLGELETMDGSNVTSLATEPAKYSSGCRTTNNFRSSENIGRFKGGTGDAGAQGKSDRTQVRF